MRKRSFFARILAFEADRPFCEAKLTPVPTRSEKIASSPADLSVDVEAVSAKALSGRGLPTDVGWVRSRDATSRNAINWQMRKRSFFARVLAFEADGDFGNRNQSSSLQDRGKSHLHSLIFCVDFGVRGD